MRIGFMGRTRMLLDTIKKLQQDNTHEISFIWTSKAEPFYKCGENEFKEISEIIGCPFYNSANLNPILQSADFSSVDLVVSFNFINILPDTFLKLFNLGVLNAHVGDLPRYKGNACPNWAILNDEKSVTLTFHEMSEELDSGPIYLKKTFNLTKDTYITEIYEWLSKEVPCGFFETLHLIQNGNKPNPQKKIRGLRTFSRKPEDARIFWNDGVENIYRLIRASSKPFEGAFCFLNGNMDQKIRVFEAKPVNLDYDFFAVDGQLLEKRENSFVVGSGNEALEIIDFCLNDCSIDTSFKKITSSLRNRLT
ncbi:MAG: formyltransferase family protein [Nitrospinota bacterium]